MILIPKRLTEEASMFSSLTLFSSPPSNKLQGMVQGSAMCQKKSVELGEKIKYKRDNIGTKVWGKEGSKIFRIFKKTRAATDVFLVYLVSLKIFMNVKNLKDVLSYIPYMLRIKFMMWTLIMRSVSLSTESCRSAALVSMTRKPFKEQITNLDNTYHTQTFLYKCQLVLIISKRNK